MSAVTGIWSNGQFHRVGPGPTSSIPDHQTRWAIDMVGRMDVVDRLEAWKEQERKSPAGRRETFGFRPVLVAAVLAAVTNRPLFASTMCDIMFSLLSPTMRRELELPEPPGFEDSLGWARLYRNVRTRLHGLLGLIDPSPYPKGKRLTEEEFQVAVAKAEAERSDEEREIRGQRLLWFVNRIIEASLQEIPSEIWARWDGSVAVDATVVPAYAGKTRHFPDPEGGYTDKVRKYSSDPDGGVYHRDPDKRDGDAARSKSIYGYEATLAVAGPGDPKDTGHHPNVVVGMILHRPSVEPGKQAIRVLTNVVIERGYPAGFFVGDRAYTQASEETFHLPLRALGYKPVLDYKDDQLGVRGSYQGFLLIEGWFYCPGIPQGMIDATLDFRKGRINEAQYRARLAERWKYAARVKDGPDAYGCVRLQCPAAGAAPTAGCPLKPASMTSKTRVKLRVEPRPDLVSDPPKSCTQGSLTVPPDIGPRFRQHLLYGSEVQETTYSMMRSLNEGMNGFLKDGAFEALDDAERRRLRGLAAQSFLVALLVFAGKVRKIEPFMTDLAADEAGKVRPIRPRRRPSIGDWLPTSSDIEGPAPAGSAS